MTFSSKRDKIEVTEMGLRFENFSVIYLFIYKNSPHSLYVQH